MPFINTPNHNTSEVRKADLAAIKRIADEHKRQQEAEERRRRDERNRAIAADIAIKNRSTSQNK